MPKHLSLIFLPCLLLISGSLFAQDLIYQKDGEKLQAHVQLIGPQWINYKSVSQADTPPKKIAKANVVLLFEDNGDYLVFNPTLPEGYFRLPFDNEYYDKLIKKSGQVIPVEEVVVLADEVKFRHLLENDSKKSLPHDQIAMIMFRDKSHRLFGTPEEVSAVLAKVHDLPISTHLSASTEEPPAFETGMASREKAKLPVDEEAFKQKATLRTQELTQYIGLISDKRTSPFEANKAIDQAVQLFVSDTSVVEVSSKNSQKIRRYGIRSYLQHLKLLKYDKVEVTWVEVNYVGDIRKGPDGNYYGYVTFVQIFRGFIDGEVKYEDMTEKRVEVMFKGYTKFEGGQSSELWDVLLSNIKVEETI